MTIRQCTPTFPGALIMESGVRLEERIDDKSLNLSIKGATEDRKIALDGLGDVALGLENLQRLIFHTSKNHRHLLCSNYVLCSQC